MRERNRGIIVLLMVALLGPAIRLQGISVTSVRENIKPLHYQPIGRPPGYRNVPNGRPPCFVQLIMFRLGKITGGHGRAWIFGRDPNVPGDGYNASYKRAFATYLRTLSGVPTRRLPVVNGIRVLAMLLDAQGIFPHVRVLFATMKSDFSTPVRDAGALDRRYARWWDQSLQGYFVCCGSLSRKNRSGKILPQFDFAYDIPNIYHAQFVPAWKFYHSHCKMFKPKSAKANQRALLDLLTGKNIFLAQEAWITLLKAKPSPLSEKFVGQLIPKLGPNRQAYFIYEMFDHRRNGFPAAVGRLVVKATTSAQLIPPATACAYAFQWQRSSGTGAIMQQINKKKASFGTHTAADKEINKLLRFAGLKPLN